MQNKKPMLQRMLAIYVIFFAVLATGLAHSVWPNFSKGYDEGAVIGRDIARNWLRALRVRSSRSSRCP